MSPLPPGEGQVRVLSLLQFRGSPSIYVKSERMRTAIRMRLDCSPPLNHTKCGRANSVDTQDVMKEPWDVHDRGIQCSMPRKGNCWDNAAAESVFS